MEVSLDVADGLTTIHCATLNGHQDCLRAALCGSDVKVDAQDIDGRTALHYAAWLGRPGCIRMLASAGWSVDLPMRSRVSALHVAAANGYGECVHTLIELHADVNRADASGATALHLAARYAHQSSAAALIAADADLEALHKDELTPLHTAVWIGASSQITRVLLDAGCNIGLRDCVCETAFARLTNQSLAHWNAPLSCVAKRFAASSIA